MNQDNPPLLVELFLERAHITGVCRNVQERRRLIDVLNHVDDTLELEDARVSLATGATKHYDSILVSKSSILAAVPRETRAQSNRRAVLTNVMGRQETQQSMLAVLAPPLAVVGTAHASAGAGARNSMKVFSKFFSLTNATLSIAGNPDRELDVVVVSRDRIVAMSELPAPKLPQAV
jgi:hypothetical protein